jgi:hypothetical protein
MVEDDAHGLTNGGHDDQLDQMVVAVLTGGVRLAYGVDHRAGRDRVTGAKFRKGRRNNILQRRIYVGQFRSDVHRPPPAMNSL